MAVNRLAMRPDWRAYMNTAEPGAPIPIWTEVGEGFTAVAESKNAQEYSVRYVHETTERTSVTGYASEISYTCDLYTLDPACRRVAKAHEYEQIGTDAVVEIVNVNYFDELTNGEFWAAKRKFSIIPDTKGDGTDALNYSGSLRAFGDNTYGSWDKDTATFTPEP